MKCDTCEGTGRTLGMACYGGPPVEVEMDCPDCDGCGELQSAAMTDTLTPKAQADRNRFEVSFREIGCTCHMYSPCEHCQHPGNPINQRGPEHYMTDGEAIMDVTRQMVG